MGAYADAYLKIFGISGVSFLERMLIGFEDEMSQTCIGSISELSTGIHLSQAGELSAMPPMSVKY